MEQQTEQTAHQALQTARPASNSKWLLSVLAILALVGFSDAAYLTAEHFAGAIPPCTLHGCETVLTSAYSVVLGVPLALLGAVYYLALLVLYFIFLQEKNSPAGKRVLTFALRVSIVGFLADLWFVSAQAFIIHAWCQYCLLSATVSTIIFIVSYWFIFKSRKNS